MSRRPSHRPFTRAQNPGQSRDSARAWARSAATVAVAGLAVAAFSAPAQAAPADGRCQAAGIATLKSIGAFKAVRDNGVSVATAVSLGVTPRNGLPDGVTLDTVIPFHTLLADHRAGDNSIFVYPWCS
ncbi:hypothetical protein [Nostocoides sp. Soil756]|jgi:hypothetical protein|uniref:hypothetical protein n=1 Tax=Nostocoides sp. Soil756 TaxID=1736399 RepID=UPI0006FE507C|nr:hypothetical protein [Tetrasphaera sp. Soil756]KRE62110.1 hypothetical protein ASG78_03375 [Tetrasphaera sp. Soil756]